MTEAYHKIIALLEKNEAKYTAFHHAPTVSSEESARIKGTSLHGGAKAIVIQGKKTRSYALFVMPGDLRMDGKKVSAVIGEKFSFAPDPEIATGCVRGSVPPLGSVIGLKTYCDKRLAENETIHFNAGSLTDSVSMKYVDYIAIENPEIVDVTEMDVRE
ncbi:MAG: YbaK/EbsC family protein [Patescibacteria group bacterium]